MSSYRAHMDLTYRPMRASDVAACVSLTKADPIVGPRYGGAIEMLPAVWSRLLGQESFRAFVFETVDSGRKKIILVGIAVFVEDDFVRQLKTPPSVWIGPELTQRIAKGHSPLLSDREVAAANSNGSLTCVVWSGCLDQQYVAEPEVHNFSASTFFEVHAGYYLREVIVQAENGAHLQQVLGSGGLVLSDRQGKYAPVRAEDVPGIWHRSHLLGITRELAKQQIGSWVSTMFRYKRPRLGLSRKQQRLLTTALKGDTDVELARVLGISVAAVKKSWRDIYDRVHVCIPKLFAPDGRLEQLGSERGRAKKQRLLSYVRTHPEELRPISRRADSKRATETAGRLKARKWASSATPSSGAPREQAM